MSKTKEYSFDVHRKSVEHHKIESGCKKIAKELKMSHIVSCLIFLCVRTHPTQICAAIDSYTARK